MGIQIYELAKPMSRTAKSAKQSFLVTFDPGTPPEEISMSAARIALANHLNYSFDGLLPTDYSLEEIVGKNGFYIADVDFGIPETQQEQPGGETAPVSDYTASFSTKGGVMTRYIGLSDNRKFVPYALGDPEKTPLYPPTPVGWLVGAKEKDVEGVEVVIPALEFNINRRVQKQNFKFSDMKSIWARTGTVNSETFLTFAGGEVLFEGAEGSYNDEKWELNFGFKASPNVQSMSISTPTYLNGQTIWGVFEITNKKGWEYLWMTIKTGDDRLPKYIDQINVIQVYPYSDFSELPL